MSSVKIPAIKFVQNGETMYLAAPSMHDLLRRCDIDPWQPSLSEETMSQEEYLKKQGYQRRPSNLRKRKIANYLTKPKSTFPSTILVNDRDAGLKFEPVQDHDGIGYLSFKDDTKLYIMDGQHRFQGLRYAITELQIQELLDFEVPITVATFKSKKTEIQQFVLVNRTQKKVKTDLGDRLLEFLKRSGMGDGTVPGLEQKDWKSRAVRLADRLNTDPESPWFGRIIKPNADRTDKAVAGESEFTKSVKNILVSVYGEQPDDKVYELITEYWAALKELMPEAFETPAGYLIQKTTGFHSWNQIMPVVVRECADKHGRKRTRKEFKEILSRVDGELLNSDWWKSKNKEGAAQYVGMGPIGNLAKDIKEEIEECS